MPQNGPGDPETRLSDHLPLGPWLGGRPDPAATPRPERAFAYLAMGERHWPLALASIRSLRQHHPRERVVVVTNLDWPDVVEAADELRLEIVPVDWPSAESRRVKTRLYAYLPDDARRVVYLDADTTVTGRLDEIWAHLDQYALACPVDPLCPTVARRRERKSPQLTRAGIRRLWECAGPGAQMPQFGLLAWRRCPEVIEWYERAHALWLELSRGATTARERGDSDAFALALRQTESLRHELLPAEHWQSSRNTTALVRHDWGRHSRTVTQDAARPPIITTVYIPDADRERFPDTAGLVRHCVQSGMRGRRHVCVDKADHSLIAWFAERGHEVLLPADDAGAVPPRMTRNMGQAAAMLPADAPFVWTVEQDVVVSARSARAAEALMARLPDDVATVLLLSLDQRGRRTKPYRPHPAWQREFPGHAGEATLQDRYATLWRGRAFRQIDWAALPAFHSSDKEASAQLKERGWRFAGAPQLPAIHWPRSSHGGETGGPL
jgi:hypothetical protein